MLPTGHWDSPQAYINSREIDWSFLMDRFPFEDKDISEYDFLHGECQIFALALHNQFGYPIEAVWDEDDNLIHAFCTDSDGMQTVFIDIRGITDDFMDLMEDFQDFFTDIDELPITHPNPEGIRFDIDKSEYLAGYLQAAETILAANKDFYHTEPFLSRTVPSLCEKIDDASKRSSGRPEASSAHRTTYASRA